jgi:hypothetical protein
MEIIRNKDISVTRHMVDGITLSYTTDEGDYYHQRYIGYSVQEARPRFKAYVYEEDAKIIRCTTAQGTIRR